jgi:hypothetical protein
VNTKQRLQTTRRKLNLLQTLLTLSFAQQKQTGYGCGGMVSSKMVCIYCNLDATTGAFGCQ